MTDESYRDLADRLAEYAKQREQALGARSELLKQLKEQGIDSPEELDREIRRRESRQKKLDEKAAAEYAKLKRWESKLKED
jgi:hypothetical protein